MFDVKQAGRLLRKTWEDPSALARELYDVVVAKGDRVIDNPVEMVAETGATALRLVRVGQNATAAAKAVARKPPKVVPAAGARPSPRRLPTVLPPASPQGAGPPPPPRQPGTSRFRNPDRAAPPIRPKSEIPETIRRPKGIAAEAGKSEQVALGCTDNHLAAIGQAV